VSSGRRQSIIQPTSAVATNWHKLVGELLHAGIKRGRILRSTCGLQVWMRIVGCYSTMEAIPQLAQLAQCLEQIVELVHLLIGRRATGAMI
jgi:hypothetical protein